MGFIHTNSNILKKINTKIEYLIYTSYYKLLQVIPNLLYLDSSMSIIYSYNIPYKQKYRCSRHLTKCKFLSEDTFIRKVCKSNVIIGTEIKLDITPTPFNSPIYISFMILKSIDENHEYNDEFDINKNPLYLDLYE